MIADVVRCGAACWRDLSAGEFLTLAAQGARARRRAMRETATAVACVIDPEIRKAVFGGGD